MAAMLLKNGPDGKATGLPDSLARIEVVYCRVQGCPFSCTLAYGVNENRIENAENVLELLRRKAHELVAENHPQHMIDGYVWGGSKLGWLERGQATAAGL